VDARLHQLQGKTTDRMTTTELIDLLRECYAERLALRQRHVRGAQFVRQYDFNNTYQYIIAREDQHIEWLGRAITELGGTLPAASSHDFSVGERGDAAQARVLRDDAAEAKAFVDRWRPRIETMTQARHQGMLRVILGETLEHKRFFDQALAGRTDLLGRRADGAGAVGAVLPTRWVE
jgi:hypothetical protein